MPRTDYLQGMGYVVPKVVWAILISDNDYRNLGVVLYRIHAGCGIRIMLLGVNINSFES